ncbi:hypothetical protein FFLO_02400 [Filobasidium floriforme]|uniref:Uncharacterized protein n=1 Tax=Filobasidium floriforme TaxID=5210 RepID=A0A8K0JMQ2_9TREE|nr:PUA-like domain-containing protein [Filobasidium floriforme]KAG7562118.1 hypothetical protein FFLO_02400 [Filobasidium floriforme]KAH8082684.1 PUA-like domain-containing protein [Filobasidium floriforme]
MSFEKELGGVLECDVCAQIMHKPVTTPCQHTFCSSCLARSLDHSAKCPLCRQDLPAMNFFQDQTVNKVLTDIVMTAFPEEYAERLRAIESEERDARLDTPIFVCTLAFPNMPTILHVFEPRYRLMLRRCIESGTPRFGMVLPARGAGNGGMTGVLEYGTMLDIRSIQMLPDGRSMVEAMGSYRFRLLEKGSLDGYTVGRVERIEDIAVEDETHEPSTAELMGLCKEFIDQLRSGSAPWLLQRLNSTYGAMPEDPSTFSYWMALVMPIDEYEKARLLPIRSPRLRLKLIVHWVEQLRSSWWWVFRYLRPHSTSSDSDSAHS